MMRRSDNRRSLPWQLQNVRRMLGDAGIPHSLKYTKMGWPYIRFDAPAFGGYVSVQYRARRVNRETKQEHLAHFLIFYQFGDGSQRTMTCFDLQGLTSLLEIDPGKIAEGYALRKDLSLEERVLSVISAPEEASYIAKMR